MFKIIGILVFFALSFTSVDGASFFNRSRSITELSTAAYCNSYCDLYGYYQSGKWCVSEDSSIDAYCCGSEHNRFCCTDEDKNVGDLYPPVDRCPNSSWWSYQWQVMLGLVGTIILLLMLAACCYCCCGTVQRSGTSNSQRLSLSRFWQAPPRERQNAIDPEYFDPQSPNAFIPPDYDSLPKDPPKYGDLFGEPVVDAAHDSSDTLQNEGQVTSAGIDNLAYEVNVEGQAEIHSNWQNSTSTAQISNSNDDTHVIENHTVSNDSQPESTTGSHAIDEVDTNTAACEEPQVANVTSVNRLQDTDDTEMPAAVCVNATVT